MKMTSMMSRQQISEAPPPLPSRGAGNAHSPLPNGIASSPSTARVRRSNSEAPPPPAVNTIHKSSSTGSTQNSPARAHHAADAPPALPARGDRKPLADLERFPPALPSRITQGKSVAISTYNNVTDDSPPPPPPVTRMPSRHHHEHHHESADPLPPPPPVSKIPTNHHHTNHHHNNHHLEPPSPAAELPPPRPKKVGQQGSVDIQDLENRYAFHGAQDFSPPEPMSDKVKKYASKSLKSKTPNDKVSKSRPGQL